MKPFIVNETLNTGVVTVAQTDVREYITDASEKDFSLILQRAIDDTAEKGGGVVYIPEGEYDLMSPVDVKTTVTLRGEWLAPDMLSEEKSRGTILRCFFGREADEEDTPQFTLRACSGVKNVIVTYPEQNPLSPVPYSPCFRQRGVDSITLENVTILGAWLGLKCGSDGNELHYVRNVYMSPLSVGFKLDMTTDIGRMYGLYISPDYISDYLGIDRDEMRKYSMQNVTGVFMGRSDWEYGYDIRVEFCRHGFIITSLKDTGPNTQISQLHLYNCVSGLSVLNVNPIGVSISDSVIEADVSPSLLDAAVHCGEKFDTVVQFNGVDFKGYDTDVYHDGTGHLSFVNCTFQYKGKAAVQQNSGSLTLMQCTFDALDKDGKIARIGNNISGAQILGCVPCDENSIETESGDRTNILFSGEYLNLPIASRGGYKKYPYKPQPETEKLYLVDDYLGEDGSGFKNGDIDCTDAFRSALSDAGKTGGIVYVSGGLYRIDGTLSVPSGVELRGVADVPFHTLGGGTVLRTYHGYGDENAEPFITLSEKSGIRGIAVHHPEQDSVNPVKFPWAVQSRGKFCYAINTIFINSWLGLDFGTYPSENHYISYISGAPIKCGVFCGNNSGEGWIENVQYNPHYWFRTKLPKGPRENSWKDFWHNQIKYLDAFKFGYNECEHLLGTFVFAAKHGLLLTKQDGFEKGTSGKFIGHGTDGGEIGMMTEFCGDVEFINTELVSIESPLTKVTMYSPKGAVCDVKMYNTLIWGTPHYPVAVEDGKIMMQQTNYMQFETTGNLISGGKTTFIAPHYNKNNDTLEISGGKLKIIGSIAPKPLGENPVTEMKVTGGKLETSFEWYKKSVNKLWK